MSENWNEIAGAVETLNRWLRPLRMLDKIPEAINSARTELKGIEEKKTRTLGEISNLESQKADKAKELAGLTARVEKEYGLKMTAMNLEFEAEKAKVQERIENMEKTQKERLADNLIWLTKADAEKTRIMNDLEGIKAKIATETARLQELREALARVLQ